MKMTLASDVILFLALLANFTVSGTLFSISFVRLAQNLQSSTILVRVFDLLEDDLSALTSLDSLFWLVMACICNLVTSAARQLSRHLSKVNLGSWRSFFLKLLSLIPQTKRSRVRSSFNEPNSQVSASVRNAVV